MELKDVVLSTLAEIEDVKKDKKVEVNENISDISPSSSKSPRENIEEDLFAKDKKSDEEKFLINLRERVLVLFEGFQAPNNKNIEAKIDLTLNFLEYLLSTVDERLEEIEK